MNMRSLPEQRAIERYLDRAITNAIRDNGVGFIQDPFEQVTSKDVETLQGIVEDWNEPSNRQDIGLRLVEFIEAYWNMVARNDVENDRVL